MEKKILFCASRASHILNFHQPYLEYYKQNGWKVHTAAQGSVDLTSVDKSFDLTFHKKSISFANLKTIFQLAKVIRQEQYTLITSHATLAGLLCRMALKLSGQKNTAMVHVSHGYLFSDDKSLKSLLYIACEKLTSIGLKFLLTMNEEDYKIAERYHLGAHVGFINGIGVVPEKFPELSASEIEDTKNKYKLSPTDFIFLCVGEFSKRKNQKCVIHAFSAIVLKYPNAKLLFAGTGELLEECRHLTSALHLENQVKFLGHVDEMNALYRTANVTVSASFSEGLPFNIAESLLCHTPVIASNVKGHSDLLKNSINGLLFNINSTAELSSAMELMINNKFLYQEIKQKVYLLDKYTISNVKPIVLKYYSQAVKEVFSCTPR